MASVKQKILRLLIEEREKIFSINEISRSLNIDYKLIHININKLSKEELISEKPVGKTRVCAFSNKFNEEVFSVENQRKNDFLKEKKLGLISEQLKVINGQFIALIFGSQVKGTATKNSDIDIIFIGNEKEAKKAGEQLDLLPYKIHFVNFNYDEFVGMLKSREFTVISEAIKKNIILFGAEDYYRILSNVK